MALLSTSNEISDANIHKSRARPEQDAAVVHAMTTLFGETLFVRIAIITSPDSYRAEGVFSCQDARF